MKTLLTIILCFCVTIIMYSQNYSDVLGWRICARQNTVSENYNKAIICWQQLYKSATDADSISWYAVMLGNCYQKINMLDTALYLVEAQKKSKYDKANQWAYLVAAQSWQLKTNYKKAMDNIDSLNLLLNKNNNSELEVLSGNEKVNILIKQNQIEVAKKINDSLLDNSLKKLGRIHELRIVLLANAGIIARRQNSVEEAMAYFNLAFLIANELNIKESSVLAKIQINVANTLIDIRQYEKAIWNYQKSLATSKKIYGQEHNLTGMAHRGIAAAYRHQGNINLSLYHLEAAYQIFKKISGEQSLNVANIYTGMGIAYTKNKRYSTAITYFEKVLLIYNKLYDSNHFEKRIVYSNLAIVYEHLKNIDKAIGYNLMSLDIYDKQISKNSNKNISVYNSLCQLYLEKNDTVQSLKYLNMAFCSAFDKDSFDIKKINLADKFITEQSYKFKNSDYLNILNTYISYLLKCYELSNKIYYLQQADVLTLVCLNYMQYQQELFDDVKDKIAYAGENLYLLETLSKLNVILYQANKKDKYLKNILTIIEQNKALALLENNQEKNNIEVNTLPTELKNEEIFFSENISKMEMELQSAELRNEVESIQRIRFKLEQQKKLYLEFKQLLKINYNNYYQYRYGQYSVSLADLQNSLTAGEWLFEYLEGEAETTIMLITNKKVVVRLIKREDYNLHLSLLRNQLSVTSIYEQSDVAAIGVFAKSANEVYKNLLQFGFEAMGERPKRIIIVPDGNISAVPFEALINREPTKKEVRWDSLSYLIKSYPISYAYSASFWYKKFSIKAEKRSYRQLLALAAAYDVKSPEYREEYLKDIRKNLGKLSGTEEEIKTLKKSKWAGRFAYGAKCDEKTFKKQSEVYQIIHLAMHGLSDKQQPMLSSLVFTESKDSVEDNFLYVYEIMNMKFSADLVVLSACETGSGHYQQGAGVVSVGYAFAYSGVPAVVTSLWSVNDQTTAVIMKNFYENLALGMRKDDAIRKAKLDYIEKTNNLAAHPSLWAAFIINGNCSPIEYVSGFKWGAFGYLTTVLIGLMSVYVGWVLINYGRLRWLKKAS